MKKKYKDYADYLKSDKWKQVKADYAELRYHDRCLLCGADEDLQHHHFNYPIDWNDDSFENIVKICGDCHEFCHDQDEKLFNSIVQFIAYISELLIMHKEELARIETDDVRLVDLWSDVQGDFVIAQKGVDARKFMDVTYRIHNQNDIKYFEKRRDNAINKKDSF